MKHKLFTVTSAISLLLCAVTAALWVRSYSDGYDADWRSQDSGIEFITCTGRMCLCRYRVLRHDYSFIGFRHGRIVPDIAWDQLTGSRLYLGSFAAGWNNNGSLAGFGIILPYWLFVLITAIAPGYWIFRHARRRQMRQGFQVVQKTVESRAPFPGNIPLP